MAFFSLSNVSMRAVAAVVPRSQVSNYSLAAFSEDEKNKLVSTLGIENRWVAEPAQCASDLCYAAAKKVIARLNWKPEEIEALFFVTQTPDHILPGNSTQLQHRLGLSEQCAAFDINQGCAGYVYGLSMAASFISATKAKKVLLLVGDTITKLVSPGDKSLEPIFADAGTATALVYNDEADQMHFNLETIGREYEAIIVKEGASRYPGINADAARLSMKGLDVFNFSIQRVAPHAEALLQKASCDKQQVDAFVFHQANKLILESIGKKMNISPDKMPMSLQHYGNTNGATIPLTLAHNFGGQVFKDKNVLMCGFGVGLSIASCLVRMKETIFEPVTEI